MKMIPILSAAAMFSLAAACDKSACEGGETLTAVDLTGLDGCRMVLQDHDGNRLEPTNLGDFDLTVEDGKSYSVTYEKATDMMSICMVGEMITLSCIEETND
jgi:hypothetical protein